MDLIAAISTIAAVIAPVFIIATVGVVWGRRGLPFDNTFVSLFILAVSSPCLVFTALTHTGASVGQLTQLGLAVAACIAGNTIFGFLIAAALKLPRTTYVPCFAFPNSGNLGFPVAMFAFGDGAIAFAAVFFTVCSLIQFSLGPALATGRVKLGELVRTPLLYAVVLSMVVVGFSITVPSWIANTSKLLGDCSIPLMLIALGVALARIPVSRRNMAKFVGLSLVRCAMGVVVAYGVCWVLDLEGIQRAVLIQQNSMPIAVFNYMWALRYDSDPESVAGMVVASTGLSLITVPVVLWFLM